MRGARGPTTGCAAIPLIGRIGAELLYALRAGQLGTHSSRTRKDCGSRSLFHPRLKWLATPGATDSYFQLHSSIGTVNFDIRSIDFDNRVRLQYCGSNVNSTGFVGEMSAYGSPLVDRNKLTVTASSLPPGTVGFFLVSQDRGQVNQPGGSLGNLCLSGEIGRYIGPGQVMAATAAGTISLNVDLTAFPSPTGPVAGTPGSSWHLPLWHRDSVSGQVTSNLTRGLELTLE